MNMQPVVAPQEWRAAGQELLVKEKELTRGRDALAAERGGCLGGGGKGIPFRGPERPGGPQRPVRGPPSADRLPLLLRAGRYDARGGVYPERACVGCSFVADQVAHPAHLNARDTTLAFVSRAPQAEIRGLTERIGWETPVVHLTDDFDADFGVDEWHGTNAFLRDGDRIFRTYFIDSRGDEAMGSTWNYLDITALGRQEEWEDSPEGYPQTPPYQWWNYHDAYGNAGDV